jgi:hypothetical protein
MLRSMMRVVTVAVFSIASCACATSQGAAYSRSGPAYAPVDQRAYPRGYDEGRSAGANDARRNRQFDYSRHSDYRDADNGYRGYGDRNAYRTLFREGFVAGYNDGFRRYARTNWESPVYPAGRLSSPAAQAGYRDGFDAGRDDARDRDRYDPIRDSRYREGDHGYERRYGSREYYKQEYRAAFEQGYERGYRDSWR